MRLIPRRQAWPAGYVLPHPETSAIATPSHPVAITRPPGTSFDECELSFVARLPIDVNRARAEHEGYCSALRSVGYEVVVLPPLDPLPDSAFVEDTAVVLDEVAVMGSPGVPSRRPEVEPMEPVLASYRPIHRLAVPGATLEGGDVLRIDRQVYVGRSTRTNDLAIAELARLLEPLGYRIRAVPVRGCLHLKTACTWIGDDAVLLNPAWVDAEAFTADGLRVIEVAPTEPWAANTIVAGRRLLVAAGNPVTRRRLESSGRQTVEVVVSEFQKAEAGLTCLSLLVPTT